MTKKTNATRRCLLAGCSAAAMIGGLPIGAALAQDDEILVTAQKRAESIQDVPIAMTAFSGEFTRDVNLDDVKDLVTFTPGVTGNTFDSFIDYINVRGISTNDFGVGGDPSVPFFKNGLYQGRNGAVVTSLFDIERAEVLRGPQGFLFGRNAIGGAISIITKRPEIGVLGGYAEVDVGSRGRIFGEAALNVPVSDNFAIRLAGYGGHEDGYVDNQFYPNADKLIEPKKGAGRFSALYSGEKLEVFFTAEYEDHQQSGSVYRATEKGDSWDTLVDIFGVSMRGNGRDIDSDLALGEADNAQIFSTGLEVNYDLGFATLTSLTGYKDHDYYYAEDFDGSPLNINNYRQDQSGKYFEQEIRLVSSGDGPFSWYAGANYYQEDIDVLFGQAGGEDVMCYYYYYASCESYFGSFDYNPEGLLEQNQVKGRFHGWAGYIDANYKLSDKFDVGVGIRYTRDTKDFRLAALPVDSELGPFFALGFTTVGFLQDKQTWDAFTPRFIARYHPNDDWMIFASATRGFKSGGYGSFAIFPDVPFGTPGVTQADAIPDPFNPEKAWSYEVGTKGALFGGAARVDANVYYYTYKDLQVIVPGVGGGILVDNVGNVDGWGVEGSMQTDLNDYFSFLISGAWADSEVTNAEPLCDGTLDCEGQSMPAVPKFSGSAVMKFNAPLGPGSVRASAELFGQTKTYGGLLHLDEAVNDGYAELALRLGYASDDGWTIMGYMENVTNELYYTGVAEGSGPIPAHYFGPSRPRTLGVILRYEFGG